MPKNLKNEFGAKGDVPAVMGNYGQFQTNSNMMARVIWPNATNLNGCQVWKKDEFAHMTEV